MTKKGYISLDNKLPFSCVTIYYIICVNHENGI